MENKLIQSINREIAKRFPEMKGIDPDIKEIGNQRHALTYKTIVSLPNGKSLNRIVNVQADDEGHILKISTSR